MVLSRAHALSLEDPLFRVAALPPGEPDVSKAFKRNKSAAWRLDEDVSRKACQPGTESAATALLLLTNRQLPHSSSGPNMWTQHNATDSLIGFSLRVPTYWDRRKRCVLPFSSWKFTSANPEFGFKRIKQQNLAFVATETCSPAFNVVIHVSLVFGRIWLNLAVCRNSARLRCLLGNRWIDSYM